MEGLQAYTYSVIDQCDSLENQVATVLGWMHISFQPLFAQQISLYFIPKDVREKIQGFVYFITCIGVVLLLLSMYPFENAGSCSTTRDIVCGKRLCSISGDWHIAWEIPRKNIGFVLSNAYLFVVFILPLIYGSWRMTIYHCVTGPLLSYATTNNLNELAAVWCLYSIGLLIIVGKTKVRDYMHVKNAPQFTFVRKYWPTIQKNE